LIGWVRFSCHKPSIDSTSWSLEEPESSLKACLPCWPAAKGNQRKLHHIASPCELKTDPWSDEIEKTQVAVGLALKQSGLLDTDGTILLI
jgi:hypothetical protein